MKTALLIGGAGGTGILLASGLHDIGYAVTILHRGIHEPAEIADFPHIHADPHFAETFTEALGDLTFDLIVITYGRLEALAHACAGKCGRLIAIGGLPIYGGHLEPASRWPPGMPLLTTERTPLADPARMTRERAANFARKMIAAEQAVMEHNEAGDYSATIIRYPISYGPNAISGIEQTIVDRALQGRPILLPYGGLNANSRCATFNAAHAVTLAVSTRAAEGRIFHCADDEQFTLGQWTAMILDMLGVDAEVINLPEHLNWAAGRLLTLGGTTSPHTLLDTWEMRNVLQYRDVVPAREALQKTVAWCAARSAQKDHTDEDPSERLRETQLIERIRRFEDECAELRCEAPIVHPYPHPHQPSAKRDHRGR